MATPAPNWIDSVIQDQQTRKPAAVDAHPLLNRYLFVPFRNRGLTILQQGLLGLPELRAGFILPLTLFRQQIIDYDELKRVPTNYDGSYQPSSEGITTPKLAERKPGVVLEAIFRMFNPHHGTDPQEDNGICEIEALRGNEDMALLRNLNVFCLPDAYETGREQLAQLNNVLHDAPDPLYSRVVEEMIASTVTSVTWAKWHYHRLQAQMENRQRSGKEELSPLDAHVCQWIESPIPKFRSQLVGEAQPVIVQQGVAAAPVIPTVQHKRCGAFLNLVDGQPPQVCFVCGSEFDTERVNTEPVIQVFNDDSDPTRPRETREERLARKQAEMKAAK